MHKNTFLLTAMLAVFTALVVGVNLGRKITDPKSDYAAPTTPVETNSPTLIPTPQILIYSDDICGLSLEYPSSFILAENELGGAIFKDPQNNDEKISLACQKNIPRPALVKDKIENYKIGSISAILYHDISEKDGTPIDKLIFKHPTKSIDIYISGTGNIYQKILSSLKIK